MKQSMLFLLILGTIFVVSCNPPLNPSAFLPDSCSTKYDSITSCQNLVLEDETFSFDFTRIGGSSKNSRALVPHHSCTYSTDKMQFGVPITVTCPIEVLEDKKSIYNGSVTVEDQSLQKEQFKAKTTFAIRLNKK